MSESTGLRGYLCPKCYWSDFFETKTCPRCHSNLNQVSFPGRGKIATFTVIRYPPEGFEKDAPYIVALIDLDDGPRVIGRVTAKLNEIRIDQPVHYDGKADGALQFKI
jgi:uncharacterized OB-fold protein